TLRPRFQCGRRLRPCPRLLLRRPHLRPAGRPRPPQPVRPGRPRGLSVRPLLAGPGASPASAAPLPLVVLGGATGAVSLCTEATLAGVPVAAALGVLVMLHWAIDFRFEVLLQPDGPLSGVPPVWTLIGETEHLAFAAACAALFGIAGFCSQGRSEQPPFAIIW